MAYRERYELARNKLLNDSSICKDNRNLYKKVLDYKEVKLKRQNNLREIDESSFKTLYGYICKFKQVNSMFKNNPLKKLTEKDIKKVLEDFQEGKILKNDGKPHAEITTYFNQIFKSTLFEFANKKTIVKKIMREEFFNTSSKIEVREIKQEDITRIVQCAILPEHKAFLQIYRDIGENVFSILQLLKKDCIRTINPTTKEIEYHIILRKEILKRSRTPRTEITNFKETAEYLDLLLQGKQDNDKLFNFELRQAEKIFHRAVKLLNIKTNQGDKPKLKDIRSSMACDLLRKGWSSDECNARLGHAVNSKELRKYISYTAIDRSKPKIKVYQTNLSKLEEDMQIIKEREKLKDMRIEQLQKDNQQIKEKLDNVMSLFQDIVDGRALPTIRVINSNDPHTFD